jgi:hypothetical protein
MNTMFNKINEFLDWSGGILGAPFFKAYDCLAPKIAGIFDRIFRRNAPQSNSDHGMEMHTVTPINPQPGNREEPQADELLKLANLFVETIPLPEEDPRELQKLTEHLTAVTETMTDGLNVVKRRLQDARWTCKQDFNQYAPRILETVKEQAHQIKESIQDSLAAAEDAISSALNAVPGKVENFFFEPTQDMQIPVVSSTDKQIQILKEDECDADKDWETKSAKELIQESRNKLNDLEFQKNKALRTEILRNMRHGHKSPEPSDLEFQRIIIGQQLKKEVAAKFEKATDEVKKSSTAIWTKIKQSADWVLYEPVTA